MEVDQAASLVLGDLGVGNPSMIIDLPDPQPRGLGEFAAKADGEAVPQVPGMGLPQHRTRVVVGARVDRCPKPGVRVQVVRPAGAGDAFAAALTASLGADRPE